MWDKLIHEWKTIIWGIVSLLIELEMFFDPTALDFFISTEYQGLVHVAVPMGFFLLRRWKDAHPEGDE